MMMKVLVVPPERMEPPIFKMPDTRARSHPAAEPAVKILSLRVQLRNWANVVALARPPPAAKLPEPPVQEFSKKVVFSM